MSNGFDGAQFTIHAARLSYPFFEDQIWGRSACQWGLQKHVRPGLKGEHAHEEGSFVWQLRLMFLTQCEHGRWVKQARIL